MGTVYIVLETGHKYVSKDSNQSEMTSTLRLGLNRNSYCDYSLGGIYGYTTIEYLEQNKWYCSHGYSMFPGGEIYTYSEVIRSEEKMQTWSTEKNSFLEQYVSNSEKELQMLNLFLKKTHNT